MFISVFSVHYTWVFFVLIVFCLTFYVLYTREPKKTVSLLFLQCRCFYWPILTFLPSQSKVISAQIWTKICHLTLILLLPYCVKCEKLIAGLWKLALLPAGLREAQLKLPVLNLLTGRKSGFLISPHRGDTLYRFISNLAEPMGTWIRLAVQNFTSIGSVQGWECGPKVSKISTFLVKSRLEGANSLTDF